jgi:hypothetical protein
MQLVLNVACQSDTMDVTSHHLDVIKYPSLAFRGAVEDTGEEISKRSEDFGQPMGKSTYLIHSPRSKAKTGKLLDARRRPNPASPYLNSQDAERAGAQIALHSQKGILENLLCVSASSELRLIYT